MDAVDRIKIAETIQAYVGDKCTRDGHDMTVAERLKLIYCRRCGHYIKVEPDDDRRSQC